MKNENHSKFSELIGKTVKNVHLSNSHGEMVIIKFTDDTRLAVCSYVGTDQESEHLMDELYVGINGEEL